MTLIFKARHVSGLAFCLVHINIGVPEDKSPNLSCVIFAGGENTPLHDSSFEGITPRKQTIQTPNVVLGTPFHTPGGQAGPGGGAVATPGRMMTPLMGGMAGRPPTGGPPGSATPSQTPLRDQLNINPDDSISGFESAKSAKQQQFEIRAQLRAGLSSLPAPKNDFEIVVPEDEEEGGMEIEEGSEVDPTYIEDAAEVDERRAKALKEAGEIQLHVQTLCSL